MSLAQEIAEYLTMPSPPKRQGNASDNQSIEQLYALSAHNRLPTSNESGEQRRAKEKISTLCATTAYDQIAAQFAEAVSLYETQLNQRLGRIKDRLELLEKSAPQPTKPIISTDASTMLNNMARIESGTTKLHDEKKNELAKEWKNISEETRNAGGRFSALVTEVSKAAHQKFDKQKNPERRKEQQPKIDAMDHELNQMKPKIGHIVRTAMMRVKAVVEAQLPGIASKG